jgi:hypothetical protein
MPVISGGVVNGLAEVYAQEVTFTETAGAGTYTGSVTIPAGSTLIDVIVHAVAVWDNSGHRPARRRQHQRRWRRWNGWRQGRRRHREQRVGSPIPCYRAGHQRHHLHVFDGRQCWPHAHDGPVGTARGHVCGHEGLTMRRFPNDPETDETEAPRRVRPADKRRRFPATPKRPVREAPPQETTNDGHHG